MTKLIKSAIKKTVDAFASLVVAILAPIFAWAARNGSGSNACLKWGFLPLPVHFYSPIPDILDLERRRVWDQRSSLAGIDFKPEAQESLILQLGQEFGAECNWPWQATDDPYQFYTENSSFSYGCAAGVHCIIRHYKPRHLIEIGSGNSSLVIAKALSLNAQSAPKGEYIAIDPYPRPIIANGLQGLTRLIQERVELQDPDLFGRLSENDVLFIDSGHTVRIGGDVNYLFLDVLPRLAPGVIVHLHDIPLPWEYPKVYATRAVRRYFWTESYLLQAFLCLNDHFEILLAMRYLMTEKKGTFRAAFPCHDPLHHLAISGSFWIRRKPNR